MATVTHYIYSHYDPKDRERLEVETGQTPAGKETNVDPWQTESAFGVQRRLAGAPKFVPAAVSYDQLNDIIGVPPQPVAKLSTSASNPEVAGWYRSLVGTDSGSIHHRASTAPPETHEPSADVPQRVTLTAKPPRGRRDKKDWFISRALRSQPASSSPSTTPQPTLADMLAREPPPTSDEQCFKPPVFLALGPANRGWMMLERSGWSEGEGLGAGVPHRADAHGSPAPEGKQAGKRRSGSASIKQEEYEIPCDSDGDISELRKVDIVDLTLSDSDEEEIAAEPSSATTSVSQPSGSYPTPLLTPIATVLKSDRLGIGLKAKTVGPYKASKKRVTHNQAALAAHIRANEEMRRTKALVGRGSKGFARMARAEAERRKQLLASLNTP